MNTPRLRSAYPSTPSSGQKSSGQNASASGAWGPSSTLPTLAKPNNDADKPMIPLNVLDAPSQRLYILFFYIGVTTWRFYDYFRLVSDETDSLWLFMKWVAIDSIFLYGLPGLRIPWLQWSSSTMTMLFVLHAVLNAFLMFRIPVSLANSQFITGTMLNTCLDSPRGLAYRFYQAAVRPRTFSIREKRQTSINIAQCLVDFGEANYPHLA